MDREELKQEFRSAALARAPELTAGLVEKILETPRVLNFFDRMERKHKHGLVAAWRRWRGRTGLDARDRGDLERVVRLVVDKYR